MSTASVIRLEGVSKRFDDQEALEPLDLDIQNGEFLTLLGPSGCGKTTILRIIAGFETPSTGSVSIDGKCVDRLPPHRRKVNTVFQSYALFPHMSVYDNVAFGLRMAGLGRDDIRERVFETLAMVKLEDFARRMPAQLSGGQQQRVAIARAVVNKPRALLLDEPLSALDFKLRKRMQLELKQLRRRLGITFVFVTHDQEEAFSMSDRVVVMNQGRVEQMGTPEQVYEEPVNLFVANFVGETNILDATVTRHEGETLVADVGGHPCWLKTAKPLVPGQAVKIVLRPEDLLVEREIPADDDKLWLPGVIEETVYKGSTWDMTVRLATGQNILVTEFFDEDAAKMSFKPGEPVFVSWFKGWEVVLADQG